MIEVTEQFKDNPNIIKAESKGKNTLLLYKLEHKVKRFDGKIASYGLEFRWHRMNIESDNVHDVHRVQGQDVTYWLQKEINFTKGLFEQFSLF